MDTKTALLLILPVASALIGSSLTYLLAIKAKKTEAMIKFKEEKYSNLIIALQGFVGLTANSQNKLKFFEEQYKSWLYSSDNVVLAINELISYIIAQEGKSPNFVEGQRLIGNIILEMRKDLLGKTRLKNKDFRYTDVIGKR